MKESTDEKYRSIFEHSAVSLWEEDVSKLRSKIIELKKRRNFNLRDHLASHPEFVQEAVGLIEVTDVNQATLQLFEADRKEQLLGPIKLVLDPFSTIGFRDTILAIDEGRSDIESESTVVTLKGKKLSVLVKSYIPAADAAYPLMLVSLIDVTGRRKVEAELQRAKEFAENLINTANVMVVSLDPGGRVTLFNEAAENITGYTRAEIMNRSWFETITPKERYPEVWKKFEKLTREGDIGRFENPILTKAGEERDIVWQNSRILERESIMGTLSFGIDITDRKRIEEELASERSLFNTLMDNLPDQIYFKDRMSRFIRASKSHALVLGLADPSQEIGKTDADFFGADHAQKALEDEQRIMRTGEPVLDLEERLTYPDRPDTWAITTKMPLHNAQGEIIGTFGITHDITERKRTEVALAWERSLFDMLMENVPDAIYFKDKASRFIRTSRSHANERGLSDPSEETGKTDADFSGPEHSQKALENEQRIIRTGKPIVDVDERVTYPGRPDAWFISSKMPLRDSAGEIMGTFGISHDITVRKQLESKNKLLATLVESADDAIVGIDLDGRITVWNRGAEALYGYSAQEMIGTATSVLIPPDLEEEAHLMRERLMRGEQITHFETTRLRKDGSRITVSLTLSAIRDSEGRMVGMASTARDVTAQKALEAQLNRTQRLESLATLAGGVAHQFNNINTVVRGYLDVLRAEKSLPARLASYVEAANVGVQRAVDITDRLLALTEPGGSSKTFRLDVLVRALLQLHEKRIQEEEVRLVLEIVETPAGPGR
jgi:PAS domain S-box-containing protein